MCWCPGRSPRASRRTRQPTGWRSLIDHATLISPQVLAVAYTAMDGRRVVVKAHKGEVIKAADGFYVIGGTTPGVYGAVLTEALSSRFSVQIHVGTSSGLRDLAVSAGW